MYFFSTETTMHAITTPMQSLNLTNLSATRVLILSQSDQIQLLIYPPYPSGCQTFLRNPLCNLTGNTCVYTNRGNRSCDPYVTD